MKKRILLISVNLFVFSNLLLCSAADHSAGVSGREPVQYMIVVTGNEILEGVYADAHTYYLTRTLRPLGFKCIGSLSVDDNRDDLRKALRFAVDRASIVIVTGGLGPTPNDITRETISDFTGIPLHEDPAAISTLETRFNQPKNQLRPNLRRQTLVPVQGRHLENASGTAVGLVFDSDNSLIIALPGPPRELRPMVKGELLPFFMERFGLRPVGYSMTLRFVGIGQSLIDQTLKDNVSIAHDVIITSQFQGSRVDFTFTLPDNTPEELGRLGQLKELILESLGSAFYAESPLTLEDVTMKNLQNHGNSLVLVEIGTGGHLTAALHGIDGIKKFLKGAFTATSRSDAENLLQIRREELGVNSEEWLRRIAFSAARLTQSDLAVVVGPIQSESGNSRFVRVGIHSSNEGWKSKKIPLQGSAEVTSPDLITKILDWLRRPSG